MDAIGWLFHNEVADVERAVRKLDSNRVAELKKPMRMAVECVHGEDH